MTATRPTARAWLRRRRRVLGLVAILLALVVASAGAAASWYFSGAVVVPHHWKWPIDATVRSVSGDRVVLSRSDDSLRPGVYGLDWRGGHAIVERVIDANAHAVTRQLADVRGRLTAGTKVAMDPNIYAGNPAQALGLSFSNVDIRGALGPMPAWLIPAPTRSHAADRSTWAIVVHGINGSRIDDLRLAPPLHAAGLPTLLITYREDLGAPHSPDHKHHMGLTEWRDLQAAARYALAHGARRLVLAGMSMGGAIVTQFMERSPLARSARGLVLDAPALDWKAILAFNAKEMGLPSFAAIPVEWMVGERIHADWDRADALRHTADFHLPILLFHGTADDLVPISTSDAFAAKLRRWVTYYRVPGAAHVHSWNVDPALYDRRMRAFLASIHA
jgi:uncharacterized protein